LIIRALEHRPAGAPTKLTILMMFRNRPASCKKFTMPHIGCTDLQKDFGISRLTAENGAVQVMHDDKPDPVEINPFEPPA
jgi:hypothetical protein